MEAATQSVLGYGSQFEEDYLIKSLGNIVRDAEYALTELVANAWDAGATEVKITIPTEQGGRISVCDNGTGLTQDEFKLRWMTLGYNRHKHQGAEVEFPTGVNAGKRRAYGRNGIGRHGMFCFSDIYSVKTIKAGQCSEYVIKLSSGDNPFVISSEKLTQLDGHGTTVEAIASRNLPNPDSIRETISARFIHDPQFVVSVNGETISLASLPGADQPITLPVQDCGDIKLILVDTQKTARTKQKQGFAFWVQNRLVGEPTWVLGNNNTAIDARTIFGRRFTILVKCDCMEAEIEPDWSGFKKGKKRDCLYTAICKFAISKYKEFSKDKVEDTTRHVYESVLPAIKNLNRPSQVAVSLFVESIVEQEPTIKSESLQTAAQTFINLQQTQSGQHLLEKLAKLPVNDIDALDKLLSEWSIQDAKTVLDEVDRRISTIRAIEILAGKKDTDELHVLHPLVAEARWLFGPEFESSEYYASNLGLKNAVNKVFNANTTCDDYPNSRKRPDLLIRPESTISSWALEDVDTSDNLSYVKKVLLLEFKKGSFKIGRGELNQAEEYIDAIKNSGCIAGHYYIYSFVIGDMIDVKASMEKALKSSDSIEYATIKGVCYSTLTQTASKRLFKLKERLDSRYSDKENPCGSKVLNDLLSQQEVKFPES